MKMLSTAKMIDIAGDLSPKSMLADMAMLYIHFVWGYMKFAVFTGRPLACKSKWLFPGGTAIWFSPPVTGKYGNTKTTDNGKYDL